MNGKRKPMSAKQKKPAAQNDNDGVADAVVDRILKRDNDSVVEAFPGTIQRLAAARRMSPAGLARKADVSYDTVCRLFRDGDRGQNLKTIAKLATGLGISVKALFQEVAKDA